MGWCFKFAQVIFGKYLNVSAPKMNGFLARLRRRELT